MLNNDTKKHLHHFDCGRQLLSDFQHRTVIMSEYVIFFSLSLSYGHWCCYCLLSTTQLSFHISFLIHFQTHIHLYILVAIPLNSILASIACTCIYTIYPLLNSASSQRPFSTKEVERIRKVSIFGINITRYWHNI